MYGISAPPLTSDDQEIAASLLWLLRGDAGQRAIAAQAMSWAPAQQVSGTTWMAPYLAQLLDDPYEAVRFIVFRSLRSTTGFAQFQYDVTAPSVERIEATNRALSDWNAQRGQKRVLNPELLLNSDGNVKLDVVRRLMQARDNRPVFLRE